MKERKVHKPEHFNSRSRYALCGVRGGKIAAVTEDVDCLRCRKKYTPWFRDGVNAKTCRTFFVDGHTTSVIRIKPHNRRPLTEVSAYKRWIISCPSLGVHYKASLKHVADFILRARSPGQVTGLSIFVELVNGDNP